MTQLATPEVEVAKIDVAEGFNVRTHMDEDGLERLAANYAKVGVVQSLVVKPTEGGRYELIAGHRRLKAAQIAGVEKVPAVLGDADKARLINLVENFHQEELDPINRARGLKALAEELGLATHKEIAAEASMSVPWVSRHLRLLSLPEGCQRQIAAGEVPVDAEPLLRKVAAVSPRIAECVCLAAKRHKARPGDFVRHFDELLALTAEGRFEDKPTMIKAGSPCLSELIADEGERAELAARLNAADRYMRSDDPRVRFGEAETDALRAAGCLIEHRTDQGGFYSVAACVTDAEMAADVARRAVERIEAEAKKRAEEEAAWRERSGQAKLSPEEAKDARKAEREQAKKGAAAARKFNEDLGRNLLARRGKQARREHGLARLKALAAILLADNPELPARGLRLVFSQLQEVEVKQLKSGAKRSKVSYADREQCLEYLTNSIDRARDVGEGVEILIDAVIAGLLADQSELPRSKRIGWGTGAEAQVRKLLASELKAVKPRRRQAGK